MLPKKDIGKSISLGFAIAVGLCAAYELFAYRREDKFIKQMDKEWETRNS